MPSLRDLTNVECTADSNTTNTVGVLYTTATSDSAGYIREISAEVRPCDDTEVLRNMRNQYSNYSPFISELKRPSPRKNDNKKLNCCFCGKSISSDFMCEDCIKHVERIMINS